MAKNQQKKPDEELTLYLPLKGKWYRMIESGEKPEEYRENKLYWCKRLYVNGDWKTETFRPFKFVTFSYGYTSRRMTFDVKKILKKFGNPKWGAPEDKLVFAIVLGNRIDTKEEAKQERYRVVVKYDNGETETITKDDGGYPLDEDSGMAELEYWNGEKHFNHDIVWAALYRGNRRIG